MIPATQEPEAGESLEPGIGGCGELPLHSNLGNKSETLSQKKKEEEEKKNIY